VLPRREAGHPLDKGTALDKEEPHHRQHVGQPETEGHHQRHSEGHPVHGNGGEQQDQRRRAGQQVGVAVTMPVRMTVMVMIMVVRMAVVVAQDAVVMVIMVVMMVVLIMVVMGLVHAVVMRRFS